MGFSWINWINLAAVGWLVLVWAVAAGKGRADRFHSRYLIVNILEQIGRYGSMALMIFPVFTRGWKFGFRSVAEIAHLAMLNGLAAGGLQLPLGQKSEGGGGVLYGLAIVPAVLFLLNGILLRHPALVAAALVFGISHFLIVKENL